MYSLRDGSLIDNFDFGSFGFVEFVSFEFDLGWFDLQIDVSSNFFESVYVIYMFLYFFRG